MKKILQRASQIARLEGLGLKRILGVSDLFAIGFGDLGSSIYYALGITALYALGATPIALGLAGVVFICTALTYAEMTSTTHESGGSASFARHAFNDLISFIAGWGLLLDYVVTIAISAFAVAPYLSIFFPFFKGQIEMHLGFTVFLIFALFVMNFFGIKQSTRISFILVAFTLVTQFIIIAIGMIWLLDISYIWEHIRINVVNAAWSPSWPEFWRGVAMAMVAYTGIESIAQLGAEAHTPAKTVPRAVLITMGILVAMYLGLSLTALSAISPQELSTTYINDPVSGIVSHLPFGSSFLGPWVGGLAAILLFVAANAGMIGASRLSFNLGDYYQLPRFFSRVHERYRTPHISLAFFAIVAIAIVLWSRGKLSFLADLYNFGAMLAFFFAHLSLIVMRIKKPTMKRPFRIPFNLRFGPYHIPISAIIGCIATVSVWVLIVITKPEGRYLGLAWMGFGLIMYLLYRRKQKIPAAGHLSIETIQVPHYKPLPIKQILVPTRSGTQTETLQMACELAKLHGAKVTAINLIEVHPSLPLDANLMERGVLAEAILKRAEAIAREYDVEIELRVVRSRSIADTVLQTLREEPFDLLLLGAMRSSQDLQKKGLGSIAEKIMRESPCRVWVCYSETHTDFLGNGISS